MIDVLNGKYYSYLMHLNDWKEKPQRKKLNTLFVWDIFSCVNDNNAITMMVSKHSTITFR